MGLTQELLDFFLETRIVSEHICKPLETEDYVVQPTADVSPPKWHLGHTTWFFETFILIPYATDYTLYNSDFSFLFNSYYETLGTRVVRTQRGNMSRPSVAQIYEYRSFVTQALKKFLQTEQTQEILALIEVGIHHEKQHQELLLTDIKYILGNNPLLPAYKSNFSEHLTIQEEHKWLAIGEGVFEIGHADNTFCYDNELGKHKTYLHPFSISSNLVTNAEYIAFINDGGYTTFHFWHAEAWDWVRKEDLTAPLYWHKIDGVWHHYTLAGLQEVREHTPVTHISYFEAFAFAQWKGCRLPTEFEWEAAQEQFSWGQRWEWTESAYLPYPNYQKAAGALGEYNGKFMVNQKVLRGSSVATPMQHARPTYRNFFPTHTRWQFTGIRLAK